MLPLWLCGGCTVASGGSGSCVWPPLNLLRRLLEPLLHFLVSTLLMTTVCCLGLEPRNSVQGLLRHLVGHMGSCQTISKCSIGSESHGAHSLGRGGGASSWRTGRSVDVRCSSGENAFTPLVGCMSGQTCFQGGTGFKGKTGRAVGVVLNLPSYEEQ